MSEGLVGLLGPGATWHGDLEFRGRVRIDGQLFGTVRSTDLLEVGEQGRIEGEVHVAQVLVAGEVVGTLHATERCTLLETARVRGVVDTPWLDARLGCEVVGELRVHRGKPGMTEE